MRKLRDFACWVADEPVATCYQFADSLHEAAGFRLDDRGDWKWQPRWPGRRTR